MHMLHSTVPFCFKVFLYFCFMVAVLSVHEATNLPRRSYEIVMVLDMSAAMQFQNRILKLKLAVQEWIIDLVPNGILLSMVQLSSCFAKALCHLTEVNESTRMEFVQLITENAIGEACIGCGLRMAIQELGDITENSVIILVCGKENQEPGEDIQDVLKEERLNMSRVVAIALGKSAPVEELKLLANLTQGMFFSVSDNGSAEDLKAAFQAALDLLVTSMDAKNVEVKITESASFNWMTANIPTEAASSEPVTLTHDFDEDLYKIKIRHIVVCLVLSFVFVMAFFFALFIFSLRKHYLNTGFYHVTRRTSQLL